MSSDYRHHNTKGTLRKLITNFPTLFSSDTREKGYKGLSSSNLTKKIQTNADKNTTGIHSLMADPSVFREQQIMIRVQGLDYCLVGTLLNRRFPILWDGILNSYGYLICSLEPKLIKMHQTPFSQKQKRFTSSYA